MPGNANPSYLPVVSLRCGIAGVSLCWLPVANVALAVFAIVLSRKAKRAFPEGPGKAASAALTLGIIGLALSALMSMILFGFLP